MLFSFLDYIDADGRVHLSKKDLKITPKGYWVSPASGKKYSSGWEIQSDEINGGLLLQVTPKIKEQELSFGNGMRIWEGSCNVSGTIDGVPVKGEGFTELTKTE